MVVALCVEFTSNNRVNALQLNLHVYLNKVQRMFCFTHEQ